MSNEMRLFGLDLRAAWQLVRRPWLDMHQWSLLSWLTPSEAVRLLQADGSESFWSGDATLVLIGPRTRTKPRHIAVELPDDLLLTRELNLPDLSRTDLAQAAELEARAASPFAADDLLWTHRVEPGAGGGRRVWVWLTSRQLVDRHLQQQAPRLIAAGISTPQTQPEVWCRPPDKGAPQVLPGFGEAVRARRSRAGRRINLALLALAALLLVAMLLTPTLQLRQRALQAVAAHDALARDVQPQMAQREALLRTTEVLAALDQRLSEHVQPMQVMALLTTSLPDDTVLQRVQIDGRKVTIAGQAANAAGLLQQLGSLPALREVRAPVAATRPLGATKESFSIEFSLAPDAFAAPASPPESPSAPAASPAPRTP